MNQHADAERFARSDPRTHGPVQAPPQGVIATLKQLGPGLIIAGSIVGSGELIATTKTGAQAGISLLWLIIVGCLIKVFVQVELGRHAITHGQTTLAALNTVPGPLRLLRVRSSRMPNWIPNWILWLWLAMMIGNIGQLGGIVGGVGQALAIAFPITGDYREAIQVPSQAEIRHYLDWETDRENGGVRLSQLTEDQQQRVLDGQAAMDDRLDSLGERGESALETVRSGGTLVDPRTMDDRYWAAAAALITIVLLYNGRYGLIQNIAMFLVVMFTFITLGNVYALQSTPEWRIPLEAWLEGLKPSLPGEGDARGVATALATFGIIGVGATELIAYPYWCIEKGYARYAGQRSDDSGWAARARGWMRVMQYDAFLSMVVYTIATLAFFVMGVAVLYRQGLDPDGIRMVSTLAESYVPMFGDYAKWLFLIGAIAVLYSTFLVAIAGHARVYTDAIKVWGLMSPENPVGHRRSIATFGVVLPLMCLALYWAGINPVAAVLLGGTSQALMLPVIGLGALYFRFRQTDARLKPSRLWDGFLIVSSLGLLITGAWHAYDLFY